MSIEYMTRVWKDESIKNITELIMMLALADFANEDGTCYPGIETLAFKTRVETRTVQSIIRRLQSSGKVKTEFNASHLKTNLYTLYPDKTGGRVIVDQGDPE